MHHLKVILFNDFKKAQAEFLRLQKLLATVQDSERLMIIGKSVQYRLDQMNELKGKILAFNAKYAQGGRPQCNIM